MTIGQRVLARLRSPCDALLTPTAVVVQTGRHPHIRRYPSDIPFPKAVAELLDMMDHVGIQSRRLRLQVADHWARPAILPDSVRSWTDEEIRALIQEYDYQTYGERRDDWQWCWDDHHGVAVSLPLNGLTALHQGLAQRGCALACIQTASTDMANHLPSLIGWLAILTSSDVSLMRFQDGHLQNWCVIATHHLTLCLMREAARTADACRHVTLIDLSDRLPDTDSMRSTLRASGWVASSAPDLPRSRAWRLYRAILQRP